MVGERTSTLSLSVLAKDLDEGLATVLRRAHGIPAFREEPLKLAKARFVEQLRQANDQPNGVLSREYEKLLYGDNAVTWQPTKATYEGITAADLKAFHAKYFSPKNMILAVSGDFSKAALKAKIDKLAAGWKGGDGRRSRPCRKAFPSPEPGVYFIQKAINQGYISLGPPRPRGHQPRLLRRPGHELHPRRRQLHLADHDQGPLGRGPVLQPGQPLHLPLGPAGHVLRLRPDQVVHGRLRHLPHPGRVRPHPQGAGDRRRDGDGRQLLSRELRRQLPVAADHDDELRQPGDDRQAHGLLQDLPVARSRPSPRPGSRRWRRSTSSPDKIAIMIVGDWEPCNKGGDKWPGPLDKLGKVHRIDLDRPDDGQRRSRRP
ncbi:MAG: insulinase family protein [Anaerotruncus sp.]|nr:insulinase family protein [Anaerotruncus sp.]